MNSQKYFFKAKEFVSKKYQMPSLETICEDAHKHITLSIFCGYSVMNFPNCINAPNVSTFIYEAHFYVRNKYFISQFAFYEGYAAHPFFENKPL